MEQGSNPFFVEQQTNVLGLDHASPPSGQDMMMPFELGPAHHHHHHHQNDSFPFVQDLPLPPFMQPSMTPHYVMHPIQPFKVGKSAQGLTFAPPPLSLNPQHFFHPSSMINNVNGTAPHPFFIPPAASPTTPIAISTVASSFPGYTRLPPTNSKEAAIDDEPDPTEKELAALLNGEGGLSVVDRVASFKNLMLSGGEKQQLMYLVVLQNKHTTKACLRRFVEEGGVAVLHEWLSEAKKEFPKRRKYLLRLLDTLAVLPMGLEALKKSQLGKTVRAISKLNDPEISDKAQKLVSSWMGLVAPQDSVSSALALSSQSQLQSTDAPPRKRSLGDVEQGAAKKKTKMVLIRERDDSKVPHKLPTTPPKGTVPPPGIPVSKHKAPPKPTASQTNQIVHSVTSVPQQYSQSQPQLQPQPQPQPQPQLQLQPQPQLPQLSQLLQPQDEDPTANKPKAPNGSGRLAGGSGGAGDDLMNQLSASTKKVAGAGATLAKKKVGTTGHKMQLIEVAALPPKKVAKSSYEQKPLSADAIHKAKLKELLLSRPSDASATPPTSPPLPSPPSSPPSSPSSRLPMYSTTIPVTDSAIIGSTSPPPSTTSTLTSSTNATGIRSHLEASPLFASNNPPLSPYTSLGISTFSSDGAVSILTDTPTTTSDMIEKEPDPNRRRSSIKNPRVTWAVDDKLTDVREYVVDDEPAAASPAAAAAAANAIAAGDVHSSSSIQADQHRSFESARLHELQQERSAFMHMKSEEDNWRTAYQEMRPREGLIWPRAHSLIQLPPDFAAPMRGEESEEVKVQRAREAQELMFIYNKDNRMAPDSPREPTILEMDYDDSKTPIIHWDEPSSTTTPSPTLPSSPVPNLSQLQTLINLTQQNTQQQNQQPQQNPGIDAILSLLGGPQFVSSLGEMGAFNNSISSNNNNNNNNSNSNSNSNSNNSNSNSSNSNSNNEPKADPSNNNSNSTYGTHHPSNLLANSNASNTNPNAINNNTLPFSGNFTGHKPTMPDNLDSVDSNNSNIPFTTNKLNNPNPLQLPPNPLNLKNFGLFNFGNLGNLLSQFPPNQLPLGLLNPALKVNPGDPNFLSALAGLPPNTLFNPSMNDRGKYGRMCTYFNTPTGCRNGNQCKFSHVHPLYPLPSHQQQQQQFPPPGGGNGDYGKPGDPSFQNNLDHHLS